jgi:DNA invertase Pin-like site-specific DNA recombinase
MPQSKAFGYIRVSGKGQIKGDGLARQTAAIVDYAQKHDIRIVHVFRDEGVSGTLADRPALTDMLVALEQNGVQTVIIERLDRLARDLMIQEAIISDLQSKGVKLISIHDGKDLLCDDPTRKLVRQVLGAIAEYDKAMTVLKLRAARDRKRLAAGKCEGRKAYAEIAPDIISQIKRLRRKPKGQRAMPFEQIADKLNEAGFVTATGRPFTGNNVSTIWHRLKKKGG